MIQFYLLSVVLNILAGYALFAEGPAQGGAFGSLRAFAGDTTVRIVLGILVSVTGAFKLLTVVRGDIPIVGDFLPAVAGLAAGLTLLLDVRRSGALRRAGESEDASAAGIEGAGRRDFGLERLLVENKAAVGIAGMIAGLVHFLFPMVLFL